jgi:hypothetical protein
MRVLYWERTALYSEECVYKKRRNLVNNNSWRSLGNRIQLRMRSNILFSSYRSLFTVYRLPSTVYRLPSTVYRLPSTVYRLPSTISRLQFHRLYAARRSQ